jgi:hypothetical protein
LILTLFNAFIGEFFYNQGDRYEGEWKDGKKHGQGNKSVLLKLFTDLKIVECFNR